MFGAFIGDIVGSKYEFNNIKTKNFPLFSHGCDYTDDTIMTVAVAKAIMLSHIRILPAPMVVASPNGYFNQIRNLMEVMEMVPQCVFLPAVWQRLPWTKQ